MPASTFEYLISGTWTKETQYIRMTITDDLYLPMSLNITIGNTNGNILNARESVYTRYQQVRVIEGNSGRLIFYGKIEKIKPIFDGVYGQTIELTCHDNLNELLKQEMNEDGTYGSTPTTSAIIEDIINGGGAGEFTAHSWPGNIGTSDTTKFVTSGSALAANEGTKKFTGSSKTPLRTIEEFAINDKQDINTHLKGHDFFLDFKFDSLVTDKTSTAQPDFNYHSRGVVPDTPTTNGLTFQYKGVDGDQVRAVFPDYSFPREASEIVTKVRMEYVTDTDEGKQSRSKDTIMINHATPTGGSAQFAVDDTITWNGGASTAYVKKVMEDNLGLIIGPDHPTTGVLSTTWLDTISDDGAVDGFIITNTVESATVNFITADPPGSIRETIAQDVEIVVKQYEVTTDTAAAERAATILQHGGDVVVRGNVSVLKWPYHRISGTNTGTSGTVLTHTGAEFIKKGVRVGDEVTNVTDSNTGLITAVDANTITVGAGGMTWTTGNAYEVYIINRTGMSVYVEDMPPTDIANQNAIITRIEYNEGPGTQTSNVELLLLANDRGSGLPKNSARNIATKTGTGNFQSQGATGTRPISELKYAYSGSLSTPTADQVDWTGGTLTLSDQRTFTIASGNSGTMSVDEYLYFDLASPTIFTSTPTQGDVIGIDKIYIAKFTLPSSGTVPEFVTFNGTIDTALNIDGTGISLPTDIRGWNTDLAFSSSSATTVAWGTGDIILSDGTTYSITPAADTGAMVARTYIYIDPSVSTSVLRTTTSAATAVGLGKILIASAQNSTDEAVFTVFSGNAKTKITGADIEALTITANKIFANTINTGQLAAGAVTADIIDTDAVIAIKIQAGAIEADKLESSLVISSEIVTSTSVGQGGGPAGIRINNTGIQGFSSGTTETFDIDSATGDITAAGGNVTINASGLTVTTDATITGGLLRTAASGTRVEIDSTGMTGYNLTTKRFEMLAGGTLSVFGTLIPIIFDSSGTKGTIGLGNASNVLLASASAWDIELATVGGASDIILDAVDDILLEAGGDVTSVSDILPSTNDGASLGASTVRWLKVWTTGLGGGTAGEILVTSDLTISNSENLVLGTGSGTKIATGTTQKLGFWNATPVVQPTHIADPTGGSTVDTEARTAINSILADLATLGLQAAS